MVWCGGVWCVHAVHDHDVCVYVCMYVYMYARDDHELNMVGGRGKHATGPLPGTRLSPNSLPEKTLFDGLTR